MTPEEKARQEIDRQLEQCGWTVQDYREMNISAALGVAVGEFHLSTGKADYLLYAGGKAIGAVEAKPVGHTLTGVEDQSAKYIVGLPGGLPHYHLPLPFAYESTGEVTQFTNNLEPDARSREVFTFHQPEELIRLAQLDDQLRAKLRTMPELETGKLWPIQVEAIQNLEASLADSRPRALIQMTMGSGKTFTAVSFVYRLIKFAGAERNLVQEYTHEDAVVDGVNVGYDVYRIATQITEEGAKLTKKPGIFIPHRDRRTKKKKYKELDDDLTYTANQLDRDVVSEHQIRLIAQTFRDRLPTEIFPGRKEVPKTLVFAKNDLHADDIVKIIREEFGKGNEFCQKITSKSTGKKPEELLADFRNSYFPRIAVTVDMIATGTDVKPLECLVFMRNINSWAYFEQMKGRGSRVISSDDLLSVTPDAKHKTRFVIVDAVGVCEKDKTASKPLDRKPYVPLDKLLNSVAAGMVNDDVVSTLAARLSRLELEIDEPQDHEIAAQASGKTLVTLCHDLLDSVDPDKNAQRAVDQFQIPAGQEPTDEQLAEVERDRMQEALKPFHNPKLRDTILKAKQSLEQVIDVENPDQLLGAGFDAAALEKARSLVTTFRQFIEDNKDEIEALQVLYSRPHRAGLRYRHVKELAAAIERPPLSASPQRLWQAYQAIEPEQVKGTGGKQLVDVIALVCHAIEPNQPLCPIGTTVQERFDEWLTEQEAAGATFTPQQRQWLVAIKDHIANSLSIDQDDFDSVPFNQFGGLGKAYELFGDRLPAILEELNARLAA